MNELELVIIKKEFIERDSQLYIVWPYSIKEFIYDNNLQDKLTLKDVAFLMDTNTFATLFYFFRLPNKEYAERYILEYPQVVNMKITDIVDLGIRKK